MSAGAPPPELLATAPLFAALDDADRAELAAGFERRDYPDGAVMIRQMAAADGLYLIEAGQVSIAKALPGGGTVPVADAGPGAIVGEMALIGVNARRTANAVARGDVRAWFLSATQVHAALNRLSPASLALLRTLGHTLAQRVEAKTGDILARLSASPKLFTPRPVTDAMAANDATFAVADFLAKLPALAGLDASERSAILAAGDIVAAPRGMVFARHGDAADRLWLVVRGAVRGCADHADGLYQFEVLGPGRLAGAGNVIRQAAHPAHLVAVEESTLLAFDADRFLGLWRGADRLASRLAQAVNADLARSLDTLGQADARIAAMLRDRALAA
jgi:CRP/FNR family transcriptional regulator, cyclic AMP receptor protein